MNFKLKTITSAILLTATAFSMQGTPRSVNTNPSSRPLTRMEQMMLRSQRTKEMLAERELQKQKNTPVVADTEPAKKLEEALVVKPAPAFGADDYDASLGNAKYQNLIKQNNAIQRIFDDALTKYMPGYQKVQKSVSSFNSEVTSSNLLINEQKEQLNLETAQIDEVDENAVFAVFLANLNKVDDKTLRTALETPAEASALVTETVVKTFKELATLSKYYNNLLTEKQVSFKDLTEKATKKAEAEKKVQEEVAKKERLVSINDKFMGATNLDTSFSFDNDGDKDLLFSNFGIEKQGDMFPSTSQPRSVTSKERPTLLGIINQMLPSNTLWLHDMALQEGQYNTKYSAALPLESFEKIRSVLTTVIQDGKLPSYNYLIRQLPSDLDALKKLSDIAVVKDTKVAVDNAIETLTKVQKEFSPKSTELLKTALEDNEAKKVAEAEKQKAAAMKKVLEEKSITPAAVSTAPEKEEIKKESDEFEI